MRGCMGFWRGFAWRGREGRCATGHRLDSEKRGSGVLRERPVGAWTLGGRASGRQPERPDRVHRRTTVHGVIVATGGGCTGRADRRRYRARVYGVLAGFRLAGVGKAAVRLAIDLIRRNAVRAFCASVRSGSGPSVDGLAAANPSDPTECTTVPRCKG